MTDDSPAPPPHALPAWDGGAVARDWVTIWQSEWAAAVVDREAHETWHAVLAIWAGLAAGILPEAGLARDERPDAGAAAAPRPTAAAAASDARDAEIERLARRVAELERRLDGFPRPG